MIRWSRRKIKLIISIFIILIPIVYFTSKLIYLKEIEKMAIDVTEKIVKSGYASSISDTVNLLVSGDTSVVISNSKNLDAIIHYNPELQRVEALLENKTQQESNVHAFYGSDESGISLDKYAGKFYTVDNKKNDNIGNFISGLTDKKTGIAVKYLTDGSLAEFVSEMYGIKELIRKNRGEIAGECLQLISVAEITKSKGVKSDEETYSVKISAERFAKSVSDVVCKKNGFTHSTVSASKYVLSRLGDGNIVIIFKEKNGFAQSLKINIPTVSDIYTVNASFSDNSQLSYVSLVSKKSGKETFFINFFETSDKSEMEMSGFRLRTTQKNQEISGVTKLFEASILDKKYLLKKVSDSNGKILVVEDLSKRENVCTIRFVGKSKPKVNIVQKESLYETRLDKVIEIGNTIGKFFE